MARERVILEVNTKIIKYAGIEMNADINNADLNSLDCSNEKSPLGVQPVII